MTEGVGWIKLHRKIMSSKTFECLNAIQKLIAIYIVLNANHEDGMWHDKYKNVSVPVKRGQLITSRSKIVNDWFGNDKEVTEIKDRLKEIRKSLFFDHRINQGVFIDHRMQLLGLSAKRK